MTTFIKTKYKISDDQTNIDKYRLAVNITVYHILSKLSCNKLLLHYLESPSNFQSKKKIIQIRP